MHVQGRHFSGFQEYRGSPLYFRGEPAPEVSGGQRIGCIFQLV